MEFSDRLKELREAKNLTQPELAKILNISKQAVSNWEAGRRVPDLPMMLNISEFFNVSIDYLMKGDNLETTEKEVTIAETAKAILRRMEEAKVLTQENLDDLDIWKVVMKQTIRDLEKNNNIKRDTND